MASKSTYLALGGMSLMVGGALIYLMVAPQRATADVGSFVRDGAAGFIVTHIAFAVGPDADKSGACPDGMSKNVAEIYALSPEGQRRAGEGDEEYGKRVEAGGQIISATPDGQNYCMHPELAPHDPHTRVLTSVTAQADGIDLDGKVSRSKANAANGRLDFTSANGNEGVDNQFWRAVGCSRSYQSTGQSNSFETEMYAGSWGVLLTVDGLDDLKNDNSVTIGIYANADPIRLSPAREALDFVTYTRDEDTDFHATTRGKIEDGVLITDPVDIRLHYVLNGMYLVRTLQDARIKAALSPSGTLKGYLAGYTLVDDMYNFQFGYRNGKNADGTPSQLGRRLGSANGAARVLGHTCQGVYQSLHRLADGHPVDGKYTSISTQYKFEARPAFVVESDKAKPAAVQS